MARGPAHRVHLVRHLNARTFVLRFDRHDLHFEPGQYVVLGMPGSIARREYTIYSGAADDFLEVLVREIDGGLVSAALKACEPGDVLEVDGPYGLFVTEPGQRKSAGYLFVGSGTGISPFHSLAQSYPEIDYCLLHGVRTADERHEYTTFEHSRYTACLSGEARGGYHGRVTGYLRSHPVDPGRLCYLCGNSGMIVEAFDILRSQGVPRDHLYAEVYF